MHNSVFGKTMENVKNRIELKLTTDRKLAVRWFSKLHFKDSRECNGFHMIEMYKQEILYDKPPYCGTIMLDLKQLQMLMWHCYAIIADFDGSYNIIYSDTYSLVYLHDLKGQVKDNISSLIMTEFLAWDPQVHYSLHSTSDQHIKHTHTLRALPQGW